MYFEGGFKWVILFFYASIQELKLLYHTLFKKEMQLTHSSCLPFKRWSPQSECLLIYGVSANFMDEYLRIGESTAMKSLKFFVKAVVSIFSKEYIRSPNDNDIARLLAVGQHRGFLRMLGSIDCMHWKWKNCPSKWKGQYIGHTRDPTIILEIVALYDLWIWHAFFGLPESHNDINVLEWSSVFFELAEGRAPSINYSINGNDYLMGTILQMVYIHHGQYLSKQFQHHKTVKDNILLPHKRRARRMSNVHLECFKRYLQLCMGLQVFSTLKPLRTLWWHV